MLVLPSLHIVQIIDIGFFDVLENAAYDARVRFATKEGQDKRIVIVDIDERTLHQMGQWPWPRGNIKRLVDNLFDEYGVALVGFDVVFAEADSKSGRQSLEEIANRTEDQTLQKQLRQIAVEINGDRLLADSFKDRPVVLGYYFNISEELSDSVGVLPEPVFEDDGFMSETLYAVKGTGFNGNLADLQEHATDAGFFSNPLIDEDGIIRRVPLLHEYNGAIYGSLPLAMATNYLDEIVEPIFSETAETSEGIPLMEAIAIGDRVIDFDTKAGVMIPYRGPSRSFPYVSAVDVVTGEVADPSILKDAIILIGTSAIGLSDIKPTPVDPVYPGVEAHANVLAGILDQSFVSVSAFTYIQELVSVIVFGLLMAFLLPFLSPIVSSVTSILVLAAIFLLSVYLWQGEQMVVPVALTMLAVFLIYVVNTVFGLFKETRHIKQVRKSFRSYLAPALVDQLVEDPSTLNMEGESKNMTFLFTDIEGFTTFTEKTEAKLLVKTLNEYLDQACQIIMEHGGTIDKMIGDAIVAIYNAPVLLPNYEQRAVQSALALDEFCNNFVQEKRAQGIGMGLTRIGINTGNAVVGNFGGITRFDYTVIGDSVNTAARLESVNKHLGTRMCISGSTVEKCPDLFFRPVATLILKGKSEGIDAWEPVTEEEWHSDRIKQYIELYETIREDDPAAIKKLRELNKTFPDDPVFKLHIRRIEEGQKGVTIVMDSK